MRCRPFTFTEDDVTYIRDSIKVSGILNERDHEGVVEDCVWDIQPKCKE